MIAWHGSPVLFDRFDASKISPSQSQGFGIYVTEMRDFAGDYAVPGIWRTSGAPRTGYLYQVAAPDGQYIDNTKHLDEQPEPTRSIFLRAIERFTGPRAGWWRFRIENAPRWGEPHHYSQTGSLLGYARESGNPLECELIGAGYVGASYTANSGVSEFVVFEPDRLSILSVTPYERRVAA